MLRCVHCIIVFWERLGLGRSTRGKSKGGAFVAAENSNKWLSYSISRACFHSCVLSARTRQAAYPQAAIGCRFPLEHGFNQPIALAMPVTFQAETAGFSLRTPWRCVSFTHACVKFTHCSGRPHQLIVRTHRAVRFHSTWVTRGLTRDWFANPRDIRPGSGPR